MRPLIRPRLTVDPSGPNVWHSLRGWDALFVVSVLLPVAFIALGDMPDREKVVAGGLMVAIIPAYFLIGRPAILNDDRRWGVVYLGILIALFTPATFIESATTFTLFGICPHCFMILQARRAVVAVVVLNASPTIRFLMGDAGLEGAFDFLTVTTIVIFFSAVFGIWMERIMQQSDERAALIEQLEAQRAEISRLSAERGALAERERLAGEIHDTLAQGFTSIIMLIQAAEAQRDPAHHLRLAVQTARENLAEARALVTALGPAPLAGSTLQEALERMTGRFGEELGVAAVFEVRGECGPTPTKVEVVLLRTAQEALANVRKHARASAVTVTMEYASAALRLVVRDDGVGLGPSDGEGYGLRGMRARVEQVGGALSLSTPRGGGTAVEIVVPLRGSGDPSA
ncbi:sensor histidine kinase [Streptosporangium sp. NPDC051022]|uniref:sensor histidine kinase n=1 Tax=Streptosporangium sp. NPDC051022 TaxID=3155752 RepID=UPI0034318E43